MQYLITEKLGLSNSQFAELPNLDLVILKAFYLDDIDALGRRKDSPYIAFMKEAQEKAEKEASRKR